MLSGISPSLSSKLTVPQIAILVCFGKSESGLGLNDLDLLFCPRSHLTTLQSLYLKSQNNVFLSLLGDRVLLSSLSLAMGTM